MTNIILLDTFKNSELGNGGIFLLIGWALFIGFAIYLSILMLRHILNIPLIIKNQQETIRLLKKIANEEDVENDS